MEYSQRIFRRVLLFPLLRNYTPTHDNYYNTNSPLCQELFANFVTKGAKKSYRSTTVVHFAQRIRSISGFWSSVSVPFNVEPKIFRVLEEFNDFGKLLMVITYSAYAYLFPHRKLPP